MEPIHVKVGRNLQAIRKQRELTLDKVSELTGVSKAMLGQIERGETNPTVAVLWKIVNGLRISFTGLIEGDRQDVVVVTRNSETEPFLERDGHYRVYPLFLYDPITRFEVFLIEIEPGCRYDSEPHPKGVSEYIFVSAGRLKVTVADQDYLLSAGEAIRFQADCPHSYCNDTEQVLSFHNMIFYHS